MALYRPPQQSDTATGEGEEYVLVRPETARLYDVTERQDHGIVSWRVDCFQGRGFDHADALTMALRRDVDRGEVERLLDRGASHAEVVEIVL